MSRVTHGSSITSCWWRSTSDAPSLSSSHVASKSIQTRYWNGQRIFSGGAEGGGERAAEVACWGREVAVLLLLLAALSFSLCCRANAVASASTYRLHNKCLTIPTNDYD